MEDSREINVWCFHKFGMPRFHIYLVLKNLTKRRLAYVVSITEKGWDPRKNESDHRYRRSDVFRWEYNSEKEARLFVGVGRYHEKTTFSYSSVLQLVHNNRCGKVNTCDM